MLYEPLLCGACKASLVFVHDVVTDTTRTRVEPAFEPGLVRQLKSAAEHDMRVGGADLAGRAIKAGLADEVRLFLVPVVVGGGKRALPDGVRSDLELLDTQRFASGAVYLRYCLQSA